MHQPFFRGVSPPTPRPLPPELCRTGWLLPPIFVRSPWERWCLGGGLDCPESLWESKSGAGASARKLSSFFPGTKPRCEQDKLEEGVSSPLSLASGWPAPQRCWVALLGGGGIPGVGGGAETQSPASAPRQSLPCWLSMRGGEKEGGAGQK